MITLTFTAKFDVPQTINTEQGDEGKFVPPNKPPPTLLSCTLTTSHHYSRLIRSRPKIGKNSERSASGSELDYTDGGIEYYVEFDDERMENPYVDESESLVCTDARYGAESDFYLQQQQQQQQKQRKQQSFVRSSSLELESDKEGTHTREAADTVNSINPMVNSPQHVYQNWVPKSEYDNVRLKPTSKKAKHETWSTSYDQETTDARELETEYANAEILENTAI